MKKIMLMDIFVIAAFVIIICCAVFGKSKKTEPEVYTLGQQNPFGESTENLVSDSDRQSVYYVNNTYYVVEDSVVKQTQRNEVVPRRTTLKDYLQSFTDFTQADCNIRCSAMDGSNYLVDLSTKWEECGFGELVVYWKTNDSGGIMITLYPDSLATVNEFLYYSDLEKVFETLTFE